MNTRETRIVLVAYEVSADCPDQYVEQRVQDAILYGTEETAHSCGAPSIKKAEIVGRYTTAE